MAVSEWKWWSGSSEEWMDCGPCDTRDEAIEEARAERVGEFQDDEGNWKLGIHIVEARQDPLRLADWIFADNILERADEHLADSDRVGAENDEGPWFEATKEQEADLAARLKRACDEWQAAHGLIFTSRTFSHSRNEEFVVLPLPTDDAAA